MIYVIDYEDYDFFVSFAKPFANFAVKNFFCLNHYFLDCFAPLAMTAGRFRLTFHVIARHEAIQRIWKNYILSTNKYPNQQKTKKKLYLCVLFLKE